MEILSNIDNASESEKMVTQISSTQVQQEFDDIIDQALFGYVFKLGLFRIW
jgi:ribosomal protein S8